MFQLNNLAPLLKKRKRIGRGGSRGGTSGRGHKGQKARTGGASKVRTGFEGGQIPLARRMPKRGFNNASFKTNYVIVNLDQLEQFFDAGTEITKELLATKGLFKNSRQSMVKVLGNGELSKKFVVWGNSFSKTAQEKIERCGGEVRLIKES